MSQEITERKNGHLAATRDLFYGCGNKCKQLITGKMVPRSRKLAGLCVTFYLKQLYPCIKSGSAIAGRELRKIHQRENWSLRCSTTLLDNTLGLGMGMIAGKIVQSSVEVEQFGNLWGLLATRPVVSESTYEVLNFSVEFAITLIVFTISEHYLGEYRSRKHGAEEAAG